MDDRTKKILEAPLSDVMISVHLQPTKDLVTKWRREAAAIDRRPDGPIWSPSLDTKAAVLRACADELEALDPLSRVGGERDDQ